MAKKSAPEMTQMPKKESDGRYHYYWRQEGRKYHVAAITQQECIRAFFQKSADIDAGVVEVNHNSSVKVWADQWMKTYKEPKGLTSKSLGMYREKLNGYILPAIGNKPLKSVTELHLQQILNDSAGMSKSHCTKLRLVMRELFGKAYDLGYIHRNPAAGLELPKMTVNERRSLTPLEAQVFEQMVAEDTHRGCLFYQMMYYCGLRPGECAALQWKHIDWEHKKVLVQQAKESGSCTVKDPKTENGFREVPIIPSLLTKLRAVQGLPSAPVFHRQNGTPHTDDSMYHMWVSWKREMDRRMALTIVQQAREANGRGEAERILMQLSGDFDPKQLAKMVQGPDYTGPEKIVLYRNQLVLHGEPPELLQSLVAYDLRHTCCSNWLKAGIDIKTVSYLMGHSDIQITANVYSHVDVDMVDSAAKKMVEYAGG